MSRIPQIILSCVLLSSACDAIDKAQDRYVEQEMDKIHNKVADDAVEQYNIAKRGGDKMQTCVQAGFVAAAYLQAKDETNYNKWKDIERTDCEAAGVPK
jgi:hypothetical protein